MFQRSGTLLALAFASSVTMMSVDAGAGERFNSHDVVVHRPNIGDNSRIGNNHSAFNGGRHHHRLHHERDTYSGDVAIYYRRGVGTWSYGVVGAPADVMVSPPNAKIIDMTSGKNDCSMENGVCVLRP